MRLLFALIALIGLVDGFLEWKKNKDKEFLLIAFFAFGLLAASIGGYVSDYIFVFPAPAREISYYLVQGISIISIAGLLILGVRILFRKR